MAKRIAVTLFLMSLLFMMIAGAAFADASESENGKVPAGKGKPETSSSPEGSNKGKSQETKTAGNPNQVCDGDSGGKSDTGKGANQGDAYDNTCDSPDYDPAPGNGNGSGERVGIPCTGCVGQADDKNPKGQMPNGSDRNNGYECDGNKGIARGYSSPWCSALQGAWSDRGPRSRHGSHRNRGNSSLPDRSGPPGDRDCTHEFT